MTPLEAARLALKCYTDKPTFGQEAASGRAVVYGNAVAFPGTDNVACFLADLEAISIRVQGMGAVHAGFLSAWKEVAPQVLALSGIETVIGHSLGGAIAILCAANLCLVGKPPKVVHAFEPPHVSHDDSLTKLFTAQGVEVNIYRHGEDIVPMVPRILEPWQHSFPMKQFGKASKPVWNTTDHFMANVLADMST